jgi:aminotransferase
MKDVISQNVKMLEISGIRKFYNKVSKIDGAISLTLGQPDFPVPSRVKERMIQALQKNLTTYTSNSGILELREEISKYLFEYNINFNSDEICITVGGSEALLSTFTAIINQGDKVLIPTPAYPAYESCVKLLGGKSINYNLNDDFEPDFCELQELISKEKPKILVLSYPCNPTGVVLTEKIRDEFYKIIKENDIIVVSDEIYSSLCFEKKYYSIAQYEDIKDKIIIVGGFSKMFSMTGLRVGYVCAVSSILDNIIKVHQYNVSCAPSISQWGAYEGLKSCKSDIEYMKNEFIKRRDYVYNRLKGMGFDVILPKGAFYIFPSISKFNMESEDFCERLLYEAKVAVIPGSAFGEGGEGYFRISYCYSMEELKEGLDRIEGWLIKNKLL